MFRLLEDDPGGLIEIELDGRPVQVPAQVSLAAALLYARERYIDGERTLAEILDQVMADVDAHGLDVLDRRLVGDHARFRRLELAAALDRLRTLQVEQRRQSLP